MKSMFLPALVLATLLAIMGVGCQKQHYRPMVIQTLSTTPGTLFGVVCDSKSGLPVPQAAVQIDGTTMGSLTDPDGEYRIIRVPPGRYNLRITFLCYSVAYVRDVEVNSGTRTRQDIDLMWIGCKPPNEIEIPRPIKFWRGK